MRSPYYHTKEMEKHTLEATIQLWDEKMPVCQVAITLISRRKQNVLRITDPEMVSAVVAFLQQHYRKAD
jgi:hypothetical protein